MEEMQERWDRPLIQIGAAQTRGFERRGFLMGAKNNVVFWKPKSLLFARPAIAAGPCGQWVQASVQAATKVVAPWYDSRPGRGGRIGQAHELEQRPSTGGGGDLYIIRPAPPSPVGTGPDLETGTPFRPHRRCHARTS